MQHRFVSIWFPHLHTDWFCLRQPDLRLALLVLTHSERGRQLITEVNGPARSGGIEKGMVLADARAILPGLVAMEEDPGLRLRLLQKLALWMIRYTPLVAVDPTGGLLLDITGCAHLRGGESAYLTEILNRLNRFGYSAKAAMADTIGAAWAAARYLNEPLIIPPGQQEHILKTLPAAALRLEDGMGERLQKLGLFRIGDFMKIPKSALLRRFGPELLQRLDYALGKEDEPMVPVQPVEPYQERLDCLEPIITGTGIGIALERLLGTLCARLQQEQKGLRLASFRGYRSDGKIGEIRIGTNRPSHHLGHLLKLFDLKRDRLEPGPGIELFLLEALMVEDLSPQQEQLWAAGGGLEDNRLAELMDRLTVQWGAHTLHRYIPDEHHWPERSLKPAVSLLEKPASPWKADRPRPMQLLKKPEPIEVAAPVPDYPPMLFRHRGILHRIRKADGPERIEQEWWLEAGEHRDFYCLEDEAGCRYWVFRSGHDPEGKTTKWFLYGFFA